MESIKAILVLDDVSKGVIKTNVSLLSRDLKIINSLDELTEELVIFSNKVVILEGYTQSACCITDVELYKGVFGLEIFFLGADDYWLGIMKNFGNVLKCDISLLDYEAICAVIFNDKALEDEAAKSSLQVIQAAKDVVATTDNSSIEWQLANSLLAISEADNFQNEKLAQLQKRVAHLESNLARVQKDKEILLKGYKEVLDDVQEKNGILKQYEAIFTDDVYHKVKLHDYVNRPLVIYFKEYEDFLFLDELIATLVSVFKLQKRKSVKVIRLFDSRTSRKVLNVPSYYKKLYNQYEMTDVVENDFLCKTGDYRRIFEKLLLNEVGLDVLIIVDSKDYNDTVMSGIPLQFNLCREWEHMDAFKLNTNNTIVNLGVSSEEYALLWENYDVDKMERDEKFLFLSSRPVIQKILEFFRIYEEMI